MTNEQAEDILCWSRREPSATLVEREWLLSNGLGGYAFGSLGSVVTRRYHGLLIAALPAPLGRMNYWNHLDESLALPSGETLRLGGSERPEGVDLPVAESLDEVRLVLGLPRWRYRARGVSLVKRVVMPYQQNSTYVTYRLEDAPGRVTLRLRPMLHFRPNENSVKDSPARSYHVRVEDDRCEVRSDPPLPALRFSPRGPATRLVLECGQHPPRPTFYRIEKERGYEHEGTLWSPGYFEFDLEPGQEATLVGSTEPWEVLTLTTEQVLAAELSRRHALVEHAHPAAREGLGARLVVAADQFIITPTRTPDQALARAEGYQAQTVIAGYPWFTDWGRDTMISLEGLMIATGRLHEAGRVLRTFGHYVRDGLIPNLFPEGQNEGLYHTADATLWFFHALDRYLRASGDLGTLRALLPTLRQIADAHLAGTRFGIGVDPNDGLLRQGAQGYQLTWMDAKVGDWVVTPRRGKAVEINALFFNALRLLAGWERDLGGEGGRAETLLGHAERLQASFNRKFWFERGKYLYDVVEGEQGDDAALRPNQLFAIALPNPVLERSRWEPVLLRVRDELLTPVGLRSLARTDPSYKPRYDGDLRARDAAYHQGTVWGWLVGPFVDAWLNVYPHDLEGAKRALEGFGRHLDDACIGSISEIFDAEAPFRPRGCVAQAWSVAEVLRCMIRVTPGGDAWSPPPLSRR
ncbi:MAG TPA: amylo-alpha-1,6-glucosidase [Polyangiaceae bacterium]|nr:amylo-alpha-1,6-glucosidase [Polyangiaceae bacterium]